LRIPQSGGQFAVLPAWVDDCQFIDGGGGGYFPVGGCSGGSGFLRGRPLFFLIAESCDCWPLVCVGADGGGGESSGSSSSGSSLRLSNSGVLISTRSGSACSIHRV